MVQEKPRIVMKPKFLFKTGFLPSRARAASSLEEPEADTPRPIGPKAPISITFSFCDEP